MFKQITLQHKILIGFMIPILLLIMNSGLIVVSFNRYQTALDHMIRQETDAETRMADIKRLSMELKEMSKKFQIMIVVNTLLALLLAVILALFIARSVKLQTENKSLVSVKKELAAIRDQIDQIVRRI